MKLAQDKGVLIYTTADLKTNDREVTLALFRFCSATTERKNNKITQKYLGLVLSSYQASACARSTPKWGYFWQLKHTTNIQLNNPLSPNSTKIQCRKSFNISAI